SSGLRARKAMAANRIFPMNDFMGHSVEGSAKAKAREHAGGGTRLAKLVFEGGCVAIADGADDAEGSEGQKHQAHRCGHRVAVVGLRADAIQLLFDEGRSCPTDPQRGFCKAL